MQRTNCVSLITCAEWPILSKPLLQNILSRDPFPEDHPNIDHWMNHTRFHGIAPTIGGFFTIDEFKAKFPQDVVVDKLQCSIGRVGGWDGKNCWIDRLRLGDAVQTIVSNCMESAEYRQKAQTGNVPPFGMLVYCLFKLSFYNDLNL